VGSPCVASGRLKGRRRATGGGTQPMGGAYGHETHGERLAGEIEAHRS
jgi:hypothetical protein